jgi:hypothetical protein
MGFSGNNPTTGGGNAPAMITAEAGFGVPRARTGGCRAEKHGVSGRERRDDRNDPPLRARFERRARPRCHSGRTLAHADAAASHDLAWPCLPA